MVTQTCFNVMYIADFVYFPDLIPSSWQYSLEWRLSWIMSVPSTRNISQQFCPCSSLQ